jgi:hypothetical protein
LRDPEGDRPILNELLQGDPEKAKRAMAALTMKKLDIERLRSA